MSFDAPVQAHRRARLFTALEDDALCFRALEGREALSELYTYRVEAISEGEMIAEDALIGQDCCVEVDVHNGVRHFHGICSDVRWLGKQDETHRFELVLRPQHWLLTLRSDSRIFKKRTIVQIIKDVLSEAEVGPFHIDTDGEFEEIPYCVQYQETDYDFLCRMMEKYGFFFFFEHWADGHRMIVTNTNYASREVAGYELIPFEPDQSVIAMRDHFRTIVQSGQMRTDEVVINAYNYERANGKLEATKSDRVKHGRARNVRYDVSSAHADRDGGDSLAQVFLEAERAQAQIVEVTGTAAGLRAGAKLRIEFDPLPEPDQFHMVRSIEHRIVAESFATGDDLTPEDFYTGRYQLVPWIRPYRAPRVTPWPRISGTHTATVVGEKGEEIDVDKQGRILVRFHWDRNGAWSCRVRVAQSLAGGGFGTTNIPRIGHEVLVTFIDGDPDRPVVIGSVYNSNNKPPVEYPVNKTQMGMRSNTSKGGGGANEILFDDKYFAERFDMTAERDFSLTVKNNAVTKVGYGWGDSGDYSLDVLHNRTEKVTEGNYDLKIETGGRTTHVESDDVLTVEGERRVKVTKYMGLEAEEMTHRADKALKVDGEFVEIIGRTETKIGKTSVQVDGQNIKVAATKELVLSCGASSIVLNATGVTIVGPLVKIN